MKGIKRIWNYITRGWEDEGGYSSSAHRILPPIFYDLLGFVLLIGVLGWLVKYLLSLL